MERLTVTNSPDGYWINSEDMLTGYAWCEDKENADAIVEACNNYEKLQQINKELIKELESIESAIGISPRALEVIKLAKEV
jgi:hypothetical protein